MVSRWPGPPRRSLYSVCLPFLWTALRPARQRSGTDKTFPATRRSICSRLHSLVCRRWGGAALRAQHDLSLCLWGVLGGTGFCRFSCIALGTDQGSGATAPALVVETTHCS